MHYHIKSISILFFCQLFVMLCLAQELPPAFQLLPAPQKTALLGGKGIGADQLQSICLLDGAQRPVLKNRLNHLPQSGNAGEFTLTLRLSSSSDLPASAEGYVLEVSANKVLIRSKGQAGLFYGCQSLNQLLEDASEQQVAIPACRITDYPDIEYRAVHLDLKHHLEQTSYYYDLIDRLAAIKVNAIMVEFEDKLRYRRAPLVGASHAISIEEFKAISNYASDRHISISPLVQGLGHASFILKHPEYAYLREDSLSDWAFSPMDPDTYKLQFALYEDAIEATPGGKYLHVGGDEVGDIGTSELSKKSGLKPFEMQMYWLNKVCEFARQHNRIPVFWDDMVFKLSGLYATTHNITITDAETEQTWQENQQHLDENISLFPKNCVYMRWNYSSPQVLGNRKAISWYKSHGLKVMAATGAQTNWPMMPREHSNFTPLKDFTKIAVDQQMDGILCTVWDDASPHFETVWRGIYNAASLSWHYTETTAETFAHVFRQRFYGAALGLPAYEFQDSLELAMSFWETAFLKEGDRNNYPLSINLIGLPDSKRPQEWAKQYQDRVTAAEKELERYLAIKQKIDSALFKCRRNRYSLQLMRQINELQIYPAGLLVLLNSYDRAGNPEARTSAAQAIAAHVQHFDQIRADYEAVFTKTRMIGNPPDYVKSDQNQHRHLAGADNSSDWMYLYELPMNQQVRTWLKGTL